MEAVVVRQSHREWLHGAPAGSGLQMTGQVEKYVYGVLGAGKQGAAAACDMTRFGNARDIVLAVRCRFTPRLLPPFSQNGLHPRSFLASPRAIPSGELRVLAPCRVASRSRGFPRKGALSGYRRTIPAARNVSVAEASFLVYPLKYMETRRLGSGVMPTLLWLEVA